MTDSIFILENYCGFSKREHTSWTLFADGTSAYHPETFAYIRGFDEAHFPGGMGCIEGYALNVFEDSYCVGNAAHTYILAECSWKDVEYEDGSKFSVVTIENAIWLPVNFYFREHYGSLRNNPLSEYQRKELAEMVAKIKRAGFGSY